jgi:hypothetical protein
MLIPEQLPGSYLPGKWKWIFGDYIITSFPGAHPQNNPQFSPAPDGRNFASFPGMEMPVDGMGIIR